MNLSRETSLYLDAVRFVAAIVVFLGHFADRHISGGLFWQIAELRHDAVIVFFVLSGFVIAHAVKKNETSAVAYFVNRAARIYSVVVPVIAITLTLDFIASQLDPSYCGRQAYPCSTAPVWEQLITSLTFTNVLWNNWVLPGTNGAYWTLGYEVPYYVLFGLAVFARRQWRIVLPVAILLIAGPNIAALLPLWLLGVAIYHVHPRYLPEWAGWSLFSGSILLWVAIGACMGGQLHDFLIPGVARERLPADYVTGAAFALNVIGFRIVCHRFSPVLLPVQHLIRWLAARTFTLYLLHMPLLKFISSFLPWGPAALATQLVTLSGTVLVVITVAQFFELKKRSWREFFSRAIWVGQRLSWRLGIGREAGNEIPARH